MKLALLITDEREAFRKYEKDAPWFGTAPEALLQGLALLPEIEVHIVSCAKRPMTSPEKLAPNIFFHSLTVPHLGWLRTAYQGCIRATRRKLREIQPDIVHGQGTERDCSISAVFSGFPNVMTVHGNMRAVARGNHSPPFSFNWLAARIEGFTIPRSDGVVCITSYTRASVESLAKKTWIVPNAVDATFFDVKNTPTSPPRILCVGHINQLKNQNALVRALAAFPPSRPFELVVVGKLSAAEPAYTREFSGLVAAHPWCIHAGFADRATLKQHLAGASGLILPTLEDNCPMVVLEAMAAGVPVAAARIGGVPDLIRHGENGLLFDSRDPKSMAQAMEDLLAPSAPAMAIRARAEALQRFHPEIVARQHLAIYREVLASSHRK